MTKIKMIEKATRMHLGRCKNCGSGWTKTNYLDELDPDVRKYFKDKGFADNADICPKCVAAAKKYLAQGKAEGATYDEYVDAVAAILEDDFEYSPITALEFARDDFKDITKACYSATKDPKEAAKEIDAKYMGGNESRKKAEGHDGWDGWEEVEGLEDSIEGIEKLAYELRHCIRGAYTHCKDWKALALYIKGLAANLDDAAELMAYKREDEDESKKNEELSPKMKQRRKLKSWQDASMQMKGFDEAGYSFLDLYDNGKCSSIVAPTKGYATEKEALDAGKKIFDDFDEYLDVTAYHDEEGGPDGEPMWFPAYGLKKTFVDLPEGEGLEVLSELSDVLYRLYTKGESASEDRRGTDRYGHPVKRFTAKDLKDVGGDAGDGDDAGTPSNFGLAYLDTTSINAFSNNFSTSARDRFLHDLAQMPVSKKSIEDLLRKYELHKYGREVGIRDFFPENGIAYLGTYGDDGLPYKTLCLRWGPALKK